MPVRQWRGHTERPLQTATAWTPPPDSVTLTAIGALSMLFGALSVWAPRAPVAAPALQASITHGAHAAVAVPVVEPPMAMGDAAPVAPEPPPEPVAAPELQLIGTAASPTPTLESAMLRRPGASASRMLRVGEVMDGYRLVNVGRRHATLAGRDGRQWRMYLSFQPNEHLRAELEADPAPARTAPRPPAAQPNDGTMRVRRGLFRRLVVRGLPSESLQPRLEGNGQVSGFTLSVAPGSLADRLGLDHGDVLVSVGGLRAHEFEHPNDVLAELWGEREICLGVEHGGVETELCYTYER